MHTAAAATAAAATAAAATAAAATAAAATAAAATAAAAEHRGGGFAVCAASGGFSTGGEPIQGPADSFYRGGASHLHKGAGDFFQISAAGQCQVSSCQEGVLPDGEGQHRSVVRLPVVIATPCGDEARWQLAAVRRLSAAEPGYHQRLISSSQHGGFC